MAADPRLAARHFTALTIGLVLDTLDTQEARGGADEAEIVTVIADGVDAFLRAYRRPGLS
ncbi:hypothetical protein GCM10009733_043630 [Nonomuraea maheshkhaliensis]|uniref:Transcriptional regulator TetR C-terminal Proteobacteria type domain-containing protein n=1 Tax=Nonomuraea maheshkhaliensis TaxID=419590 RepID=A0ABN2FDP5_9ACTN